MCHKGINIIFIDTENTQRSISILVDNIIKYDSMYVSAFVKFNQLCNT